MKQTTEYISIAQLATRLGKAPRTVHQMLQAGAEIPGVISYRKVNPQHRNSPYLILALPLEGARKRK